MSQMTRSQTLQAFFDSIFQMERQISGAKITCLRDCELTHPQAELLYLATYKGEISIKQIGELLNITSSAATQLVESLVRKGFMQRLHMEDDRRGVHVLLTPEGAERFKKFKDAHMDFLEKRLSVLTDEELTIMVALRQKVIDSQK